MIAFGVKMKSTCPRNNNYSNNRLSLQEDGLVDFEYGQYTAQHIPNAKFVPFESGGHLGRTSDAIHNETMIFLRENQITREDRQEWSLPHFCWSCLRSSDAV